MSGPYDRQEVPEVQDVQLVEHLATNGQPVAAASEVDGVRPIEPRVRIFALMLALPEEEWTAGQVVEALGEEFPTSADAVRDMFYVLLYEGLAEPVPFQRALTVRLTPAGCEALRASVDGWRTDAGQGLGVAGP
jgi:hypothetical protein